MNNSTKILAFAALFMLGFSLLSCDKSDNDIAEQDCVTKAFYRGINICYDGENAAAIELENGGQYLILSDFFEHVGVNELEYDDELYVDYVPVDLTPSPALCGALIVAPITTLTCISTEE